MQLQLSSINIDDVCATHEEHNHPLAHLPIKLFTFHFYEDFSLVAGHSAMATITVLELASVGICERLHFFHFNLAELACIL